MTIFLPQPRIVSMKARSVSVNGRSADVTNRTKSARGTKSDCQPLVLAQDGVGARRIDDVDVAEKIDRRGHDLDLGRRRAVRRRRRRIGSDGFATSSA